jgi:hypothetical protein
MRKALLALVAISSIGSYFKAEADPNAAIADLEAKLQKACVQHDLQGLKSCYELDGISTDLIDQSLNMWQEYWNENGKTQWTFDKIEYASLSQLKSDKSVFWENLETEIKPQKMGEHIYAPNLEVIGFITARFKGSKGGSVGSMQPVGIAPDGTAKIASPRRVQ